MIPESDVFHRASGDCTVDLLDKMIGSGKICDENLSESDSESERDSARLANRLNISADALARFWPKVGAATGPRGCWEWTGSVTRGGYGQFTLPRDLYGKQPHVSTHRFLYELIHGALPSPKVKVCHRCDNPRCVRPSHLFLGSQQDNLADARRKGRLDESRARVCKLTPQQRVAIFEVPAQRGIVAALARQYRVSTACVSVIRRGRFVRPQTPLDRVFERVQTVHLPVRGVLHVGDSSRSSIDRQNNSIMAVLSW